jgi:O-antigen/teichoic acid export membrane protein
MATVPFYEFSARLSGMVRAVPLLMMSALIPATSELGARNDKEKIIQTYLMTSRYVALVAVGLVAFVALEAERFSGSGWGPEWNSPFCWCRF